MIRITMLDRSTPSVVTYNILFPFLIELDAFIMYETCVTNTACGEDDDCIESSVKVWIAVGRYKQIYTYIYIYKERQAYFGNT